MMSPPSPVTKREFPFPGYQVGSWYLLGYPLKFPGVWRAEPEETTVPWVILPHAAFLEVFLLLVVLKLEIG